MRIIDVRPLADGWAVQSDQIENDLVFLSGRAAECAAVDLADRLASTGTPCEVHIHLRDGSLGGRFLSAALIPPEKGAEPLSDPAMVLEAA